MRRFWTLLVLALGFAPAARAVDETEIKIVDRWSVVGVISGNETNDRAPTGVAVLRNNGTKRTYTLAIGDSLPMEFGFVLQSVRSRTVVVAKGPSAYTLSFSDGGIAADDAPAAAESPSRTQRFLDNYYRGLESSPVEVLERDDAGETVPAPRETAFGLQRFNTLKDDRSRFDIYRADRTYRVDPAGESGSFVVNYDNFEDERDTDERGEGGTYSAPRASDPADQAVDESAPLY